MPPEEPESTKIETPCHWGDYAISKLHLSGCNLDGQGRFQVGHKGAFQLSIPSIRPLAGFRQYGRKRCLWSPVDFPGPDMLLLLMMIRGGTMTVIIGRDPDLVEPNELQSGCGRCFVFATGGGAASFCRGNRRDSHR